MKPYYMKYDDHYRALYDQGIEFWSAGPDHRNEERIAAEIKKLPLDVRGATVLDVGCGEGHLAEVLTGLGCRYTGVDISPAAIEKAAGRTKGLTSEPEFHIGDVVTGKGRVLQKKYDIVLDQACFHMIVVDTDCHAYLKTIGRMLHENSFYLLLQQALCEHPCSDAIDSIQRYEEVFQDDLEQIKVWEAWDRDHWKKVELPRFACRRRTETEYIKIIEKADLSVRESRVLPNNQMISFQVTKPSVANRGHVEA